MARIIELEVRNYRSIEGPLSIKFPSNCPVVVLGENNVGKSNLLKAINLTLGSFWPGTHDPEDHEFFNRERERSIQIVVRFDEDAPFGRFTDVTWSYDAEERRSSYFGYRAVGGGAQFIRNDDRDTCTCVLLEAERELRYQLSYSSKYTLMSKLMHKFHKSLQDDGTVKGELEALFDSVKQKFQEIPQFQEFVEQLRLQLGDFIGSMTHRLQVDFEAYNPVNFFHALRLQADEGGIPRAIDEMGTGEQQILALSFAYAYAKAFHGGIVLALEEPEAHLHPLAQKWLADRLFAMCESGLQIVVTTHSPHFVNLLHLEGLVLLRKDDGSTRAIQLSREQLARHCLRQGARPGRTTSERILPFYHNNATPSILEGLFAKVVILVEGASEELALPVYFARLGFNTAANGVAVIDVGGKGDLAKWRRLFTAYEIPVHVVFDNDAGDDVEATKRIDALRSIGIPDDNHDAIIQATDWTVTSDYTVFGRDFEHTMRRYLPDYENLEASARAEGISGKPLIARWVAERVILVENWEGVQRLREMIGAIEVLGMDDEF